MKPFQAVATLSNGVMIPGAPPALDALLMAAVAVRDQLPPPGFGPLVDIEIPIQKKDGIYMASCGEYEVEAHERRHINRRFPMLEAQSIGKHKMSINIKAGPSKGYRIPVQTAHLKQDRITFYGVGDLDSVRELLELIAYIGKKRSVGLGRVAAWVVEPCKKWPGFPVLREGKPMRPLPKSWPGLQSYKLGYRVLSPPYWERHREEECAC